LVVYEKSAFACGSLPVKKVACNKIHQIQNYSFAEMYFEKS